MSRLFLLNQVLKQPKHIFRFSSIKPSLLKPVASFGPHWLIGAHPTTTDSTKTPSPTNNRILTVPNVLTLSRIASIPFINYFIFVNQHELACGLFVAAAITDFLDGKSTREILQVWKKIHLSRILGLIARRFPSQSSQLGSILDPLADKLLIGTLAVTLTLNHMLPLELLVLILGRDIALILASLYVRYTLVDKPITWAKYVNVSKYAPVQVQADRISKFNTFLQLTLISVTLPSTLLAYQDSAFLIALQYLTGFTTILSAISYLLKRGSYKLIKKN